MEKISQLRNELEQNETVLQVIPVEDLVEEWHRRKKIKPNTAPSNSTLKNYAGFVSPALDSIKAFRICKDLGLNGQYVIKTIGDKQYIIFKGYPGLRTLFTAPRYLATHKKVIKMGIGKAGIKSVVRGGGILTIVLFTGINVFEYILNDHATMSKLIGTMASDMIKVGISSIISASAVLVVGGTTVVAFGPLVVAICVGIATTWILDSVDKQYGMTDKLVAALTLFGTEFANKKEELENKLGRSLHETEREIIFRALKYDIDNPFGLIDQHR